MYGGRSIRRGVRWEAREDGPDPAVDSALRPSRSLHFTPLSQSSSAARSSHVGGSDQTILSGRHSYGPIVKQLVHIRYIRDQEDDNERGQTEQHVRCACSPRERVGTPLQLTVSSQVVSGRWPQANNSIMTTTNTNLTPYLPVGFMHYCCQHASCYDTAKACLNPIYDYTH